MSTKLTQKEATVKVVKDVLGTKYDSSVPATTLLTKEEKKTISTTLKTMFQNGEIETGTNFDLSKLGTYIPSLIGTWLKKSTELNGGTKFKAIKREKKEGETTVSKKIVTKTVKNDVQLIALQKLMSIATTEEDKAELQEKINERIAALS